MGSSLSCGRGRTIEPDSPRSSGDSSDGEVPDKDVLAKHQGTGCLKEYEYSHYVPSETYLITKTGMCYHTNTMCRGLRSAMALKIVTSGHKEMSSGSLRPCRLCAVPSIVGSDKDEQRVVSRRLPKNG